LRRTRPKMGIVSYLSSGIVTFALGEIKMKMMFLPIQFGMQNLYPI